MTEPTIHVGVTRRVKTSDGNTTDYAINISGIPASASDELINQMLSRAGVGIDMVCAELDQRISAQVYRAPSASYSVKEPYAAAHTVNMDAFDKPLHELVPSEPADACPICGLADGTTCGESFCSKTPAAEKVEVQEHIIQDPVDQEPVAEVAPIPSAPGQRKAEAPIFVPPVTAGSHSTIIGNVNVDHCPEEWEEEPITEAQMIAVNAGLTTIGWGGKMRHTAAQRILSSYENDPFLEVASIKELTKASAHVILEWLSKAGAPEIAALYGEKK